MKKVLALILAVITMLSVIATTSIGVSAAAKYSTGTYIINVSQGVNVRKGPGTSYAKVTAIPNKKEITITEVKNSWGYTSEYKGWVCLDYTKYVAPQNNNAAIGQYKITAKEGVNVRTNAGSSYKKVGAVKYNTIVTITSIKNNWGYAPKYGGWLCLSYAKQITVSNDTVVVSSGIPSSAYKKTGVVYTVSGYSYYQAKTTRAYNSVAKDSVFYVDTSGSVVNNATILNKLYTLELFNNIRSNQQNAASLWASAADDYYDICTAVTNNEKMGSLIGKTSGILLSIGAGNSFGIQEAALEIGGEVCSPETVKTAVLLGMLRVYANNAAACGTKASVLMKNNVTDFDTMIRCANLYAECAANFAVVEYLGGDTVREMAKSSVSKELTKYFKNVILGFADAVIPDIKSAQITKYVTDGVIALGDFAINSGAKSVYVKELAKQKAYLSSTYAAAKTMADKLRQNEWDSLVGKTVASIKNGSSYTAWYSSSKNISAKGGYIGECTWYVVGRMGEVTGVKLTKAPHAKSFLSANKNNSDVTVVYGANKIVSQCIAVDTSGKYGHVMFIEHVEYDAKGNPQTVYFTECNWDSNSTYNAGKDCVLKKLSYSQFVAQRSPDGYIIAK